jgi:methionine-rich copper-binding protein CopC
MRRSLPVIFVMVLALLAPAAASAHARLEGTEPPEGAVVKAEPSAVIFGFDEPVEGNFGAVRVYDAGGERVDEGDAFHPDGEGPKLGVHLKPGLPDGSYTATYRVVSADGHIVSSGYVFSIGKAGRAPTQTVGEMIGGAGNGRVTEVAYGLARGLEYTAIALAVGGVAFLFFCWLPTLGAAGVGEESRRGRRGRLRQAPSRRPLDRRRHRPPRHRRPDRPRGRRGGRRLRLLRDYQDDHRRDPRNPLRHRLGLRLPGLDRRRDLGASAGTT